jgi:hypothetical protein
MYLTDIQIGAHRLQILRSSNTRVSDVSTTTGPTLGLGRSATSVVKHSSLRIWTNNPILHKSLQVCYLDGRLLGGRPVLNPRAKLVEKTGGLRAFPPVAAVIPTRNLKVAVGILCVGDERRDIVEIFGDSLWGDQLIGLYKSRLLEIKPSRIKEDKPA